MRERVVPAVLVEWTVLYLSYRVLPLITGADIRTFHDTSARESEDTRMKILQVVYEVTTQSVPVVFRE